MGSRDLSIKAMVHPGSTPPCSSLYPSLSPARANILQSESEQTTETAPIPSPPHPQMRPPASSTASRMESVPLPAQGKTAAHLSQWWQYWEPPLPDPPRAEPFQAHSQHTCTQRFRCLLTRARRHRALAGTQGSSLSEDLGSSSRASTWKNGQSLKFSTRDSTGSNPAMLQGRRPQRSFMVSGLPGRDWAECEHRILNCASC